MYGLIFIFAEFPTYSASDFLPNGTFGWSTTFNVNHGFFFTNISLTLETKNPYFLDLTGTETPISYGEMPLIYFPKVVIHD